MNDIAIDTGRAVARALRMAALVLAAGLMASHAGAAGPKAAAPRPSSGPTELTGTVSRVVDGDTLWLKTETQAEPAVIRIEGIDAPEICQPWGPEAKQALIELALNRQVTAKVVARDDHGRLVARVYDGPKDIGDRLVRDGHAWSTRYKYDRGPYVAEERMAQGFKRGLHGAGGEAPVMPREFRQRHGPCTGETSAAPAPAATTVVAAATASPEWRCDGRVYCSQMHSCAEATWFLKHCAGVKMDGNRDGVPCEAQWCGKGQR